MVCEDGHTAACSGIAVNRTVVFVHHAFALTF
jgi:seryl-tRNA synthetase